VNSQKIDAVLPLTRNDYERFKILQKSLTLFFKDLGTCWIVVPDRDFYILNSLIKNEHFVVLPESSLIPEFNIFRKIFGWYKQQLIKIAIAEKITSSFYLTLDADVICTRVCHYSDFLKEGRAVCNLEKEGSHFLEWYAWVEDVLQLKGSNRYHSVTPAILSKEAMIKLHEYISLLSEKTSFSSNKRSIFLALLKYFPILQKIFSLYRTYLLLHLPWTEYSLYYSFLEEMNLFDQYHFIEEIKVYDNCVWNRDEFDSWNPAISFNEINSCFTVVQSNTNIPAEEIWQKVRTFLV
jgi:hypothetical protein